MTSKKDLPSQEASDPPTQTRVRKKPPNRLDADGRERPAFLLEFPNDPELRTLIDAFERGDFKTVREQASKLAETTGNGEVRAAALELRRRIEPEPLVVLLLMLAAGLLAFLIAWTYVAH
jgi:hypothetical protein